MIASLISNIKALILTVLVLIKKVLCCAKRKKNLEEDDELSFVAVHRPSGNPSQGDNLSNWETWGEERRPDTVADRIQAYRQSVQKKQEPAKTDEAAPGTADEDIFADLAPKVQRQQKHYIGPKTETSPSNRLSCSSETDADPIFAQGGELTNWGETPGGWEAEDEDLNLVLKEQRRATRSSKY